MRREDVSQSLVTTFVFAFQSAVWQEPRRASHEERNELCWTWPDRLAETRPVGVTVTQTNTLRTTA